ncbi:MAG: hypothetical protein MSC30_15260 [Gaiellaceae bacterium MAG52_C11]|nr:hypothetical protein [Candidatus Gaiellasilicea maunaloa]
MTDLEKQAVELEELAAKLRAEKGSFKVEVDRLLAQNRRDLDQRLAAPLRRLTRIAQQR